MHVYSDHGIAVVTVRRLKVLVTGASGQLGSDLVEKLSKRSHDVVAMNRSQLDITNSEAVSEAIKHHRPDVLINCAAMVNVDSCEIDIEAAFKVNALPLWQMALVCNRVKTKLVQISTDYVFDGRKGSPYNELDQPNPINIYGMTKLIGELFVRNYCERHIIVRTAGLYGVHGSRAKRGNFVEFVITAAMRGEPLHVVTDIVTSPTFTADLAEKLCELIEADAEGVIHVVNSGKCSWHEFATYVLQLAGLSAEVMPISSEELSRPARRPKFTALESVRLSEFNVKPLRWWGEAIRDYLMMKGILKS
ncbi:MAG: hypothetical protein HZRFUVUK_000298 [Candidatus Fervidibacterota bacterium]